MLVELNSDVIRRMADIQSALEDLTAELEEQYDNLSERSQDGEPGERIQDDINDVEYITSDVQEIAEMDEDDIEYSPFSEIFAGIDNLLEKEY